MKIDIKINIDTLITIHKLLQLVYDLPHSVNKTENIYKSIGKDLAELFDKKHKSKVEKSDLFDMKKLMKIKLKFHEAWALQEILLNLKPQLETEYQHALILKQINYLNKKIV